MSAQANPAPRDLYRITLNLTPLGHAADRNDAVSTVVSALADSDAASGPLSIEDASATGYRGSDVLTISVTFQAGSEADAKAAAERVSLMPAHTGAPDALVLTRRTSARRWQAVPLG